MSEIDRRSFVETIENLVPTATSGLTIAGTVEFLDVMGESHVNFRIGNRCVRVEIIDEPTS